MAKFTMPMVYHHISHLQQVPGIQKRRHLHIGSVARRIDNHIDNWNHMAHEWGKHVDCLASFDRHLLWDNYPNNHQLQWRWKHPQQLLRRLGFSIKFPLYSTSVNTEVIKPSSRTLHNAVCELYHCILGRRPFMANKRLKDNLSIIPLWQLSCKVKLQQWRNQMSAMNAYYPAQQRILSEPYIIYKNCMDMGVAINTAAFLSIHIGWSIWSFYVPWPSMPTRLS